MDIRKIQATGGSSLALTLPKKWINQMNIKDKDGIIVSEQKTGDLLLKSQKRHNQKRLLVLNVTEVNEANIKRYISSIYKIGAEELTIKTDTKEIDKSSIRKITSKLMGWEIVNEGGNFVLLQNILDITRVSMNMTLGQLFSQSREMLSDAGELINRNDEALARDIIERDDEADKLCLLIERAYFSVLTGRISEGEVSFSVSDAGYYKDVAIQLERICDHAVKIAKITMIDRTDYDSKNLTITLEKLIKILTQLEKLVITEEPVKTNDAIIKINELKKETFFNPEGTQESSFTNTILQDSLNRIRGLLGNVAEDIIDHIVMKQYS